MCFAAQLGLAQTNPYKPDVRPAPQQVDGKKLVWHDEFNIPGKPKSDNWSYEEGFVRNRELQWYQPDNAFCADNRLVLEGRRVNKPNPQYGSDKLPDWARHRENIEFTSACVITKDKHSWKYGRFEIRAKIPTELGSWPAIWLLGINPQKGWPDNGEIDIMEFYIKNGSPSILANVAWGTGQKHVAKWDEFYQAISFFTDKDPDWTNKYHIWRMEWTPTAIELYLDDYLLNRTSLDETINPDGYRPFTEEQYLLLNLALGSNGGDPTDTTFPLQYEIDYVRVYQDATGTYNGKKQDEGRTNEAVKACCTH